MGRFLGRFLIIAALLAFLAASAIYVVVAWQELGVNKMSGHGIAALIAGAVLSLLVGGGLMALVFFSARRGYDDEAGKRSTRSFRHDADPED